MKIIGLELTSICNRYCRHCNRNRADPLGFLPLKTAAAILSQARLLGFQAVALTGGEVALYPHLGDLLHFIAGQGFRFTLVTNGYEFPERVLPQFLQPRVKELAASICFSLDGAKAATHDGLRGPKSFWEVLQALLLCREHGLPASLKSVVTVLNQGELAELARLGAELGVSEHDFLFPFPTPRLIREGLLPSYQELSATMRWIAGDLAPTARNKVNLEGFSWGGVIPNCRQLVDALHVDYLGNLIFCCNLSHVTLGDGIPTPSGRELLADLKEVSLRTGIIRQFRQAAELMEDMLKDNGTRGGLSETPCLRCLKYFGKLEWLKDFPDSPWTARVWGPD
ncbi:MAG: radical SAM protein [Desulfobacteraceae bacterium]